MLYDMFFNVLILIVDDKGRDKCYMICFSMGSFPL